MPASDVMGAAFEIGYDAASADAFKFELLDSTACRHRSFRLAPLSDCCNLTFANHGRRCTITGEKLGQASCPPPGMTG